MKINEMPSPESHFVFCGTVQLSSFQYLFGFYNVSYVENVNKLDCVRDDEREMLATNEIEIWYSVK